MDTKYINHNLSNFRRGSTNFRQGEGQRSEKKNDKQKNKKKK